MSDYVVHVDQIDYTIEQGDLASLNVVSIDEKSFHLLKNNKAFYIRLIHADYQKKMIALEVNGNSYSLKISDSYDQMVKKMGLLVGNSQKAKDIKAPMPGLIIDVMVDEGQKISEGTPLVILSAMKMENILLAQADGIIKSINVKKEDTVDKGQIIIEIE